MSGFRQHAIAKEGGDHSPTRSPLKTAAQPLQAKLSVKAPDDDFEREADQVSDAVMRMPAAPAETRKKEDDPKQPIRRKEDGKKKEDEKKPVQRAVLEDEESVQAKFEAGGLPQVTPGIESAIQASRGGGHPLPEASRAFFEPRFGRDFSQVRLHTDSSAAGLARDLNAQAFTQGRNIYFGEGRYQPHTDAGRRLLGHELTHTVQQGQGGLAKMGPPAGGASVQRQVIQRAAVGGAGAGGGGGEGGGGRAAGLYSPSMAFSVDAAKNPKAVHIPRLYVPEFKKTKHPALMASSQSKPLYRAANYQRGNPGQVRVWENAVGTGNIEAKLRAAPFNMRDDTTYYLDPPASAPSRFRRIGGPHEIANGLKRPFWWRSGKFEEHQVDHIAELQMSGWPRVDWANNIANMEMLNAGANASSGGAIHDSIEAAVEAFRGSPVAEQLGTPVWTKDKIKKNADIVFDSVDGHTQLNPSGGLTNAWTRDEVTSGAFLDEFNNAPRANREVKLYDLDNSNPNADTSVYSPPPNGAALERLVGSQRLQKVYVHPSGGFSLDFPWDKAKKNHLNSRRKESGDPEVRGFEYTQVNFNTDKTSSNAGSLVGQAFSRQKNTGLVQWAKAGPFPLGLIRVPGAPYASYLDKAQLQAKIQEGVTAPAFSPIQFNDVEVTDRGEIRSVGQILPTIPLLSSLGIDIVLEGDDLRVEKTFAGPDINPPMPFRIEESNLTISLGTSTGLGIRRRVDFAIDRVGRGFVEGRVGTSQAFALDGGFDFDSQTFNPARIRLHYQEGRFSGEGELGIPAGKVRGIKSAALRATYANERLEARGTAEFSIPGLRQGALTLVYSEAEGLTLGGSLEMGNLPGIRSGTLSAEVRKPAGSEEWSLSARGTAIPNIPGVESTLNVSYENGVFAADARAAYNRGLLSGTVEVGATNRPLDAQGQPVPGAEPSSSLTLFGAGQLTVRLTPWLQGTARVRLLPNGEIEVSGSIGLPASVDIFPEKRLDKSIFRLGIDIPILGVAVAGQRIGIFATVSGGLDATAGIGPGQLREMGLNITYNPAHEDQTRITGRALLSIPAQAGLRLSVRGGLGAGIPIVSATAALEVGGSLGLEGVVQAGVQVDWTPSRGLTLDARGEIFVQPKFRFDVTGMVLVEANLLLTTIELYSKRWNLAAFEYGSNMRFGVRFPVHYEEGRPFDISLSDVQFEVPEIEPSHLLADLVKRIV